MIEILTLFTLFAAIGFFVYGQFFQQKTNNQQDSRLDLLEKEKSDLIQSRAQLEAQLLTKTEEAGELRQKLEQESDIRKKREVQNKEVYLQLQKLEGEYKSTREKLEESQNKIITFEQRSERAQKEIDEKNKIADEARRFLEEERQRIQAEELQAREDAKARQHSLWNDFELSAVGQMKLICDRDTIALASYDNTNLPPSFDGKLKPDMIVGFLGQYIIFDAKSNKVDSKNSLMNYLKDQAKKTADKIKQSNNTEELYHTHYFVVPEIDDSVSKTTLVEGGFTFHVITLAAFEPIVATLKRVEDLHRVEELDPQERDHLATVLSQLEHFIRNQNAANILIAKKSHETLAGMHLLGSKWQDQVDLKSSQLAPLQLNKSQVINLGKMENQVAEVENLTRPKAIIDDESVEKAGKMF